MNRSFRLSPSKLGVLVDCPRCFWNQENAEVKRPRGAFPSLPGGIDRIAKAYFDQFRGSVTPEIEGKVEGKLYEDTGNLRRWRYWKTGLEFNEAAVVNGQSVDVSLYGAIDDLLVVDTETENGVVRFHIPLDYKTKGGVPKDDGRQYYQTQLDCYMLLLEANKMRTMGKAYLVYFYPVAFQTKDDMTSDLATLLRKGSAIDFDSVVYALDADPERARKLIARACVVLIGDQPDAAPGCEYCAYAEGYVKVLLRQRNLPKMGDIKV